MLIQPYNPAWPHQLNQIREVIEPALSGLDYEIEHVGSTAVPNLAAKAIIDIDIIFEGTGQFAGIKAGLEQLGYYHNGDQGIPDREAFKRRAGEEHPVLDEISHHLYVCVKGCAALQRHLVFRDHLRKNPEACRTYAQMKYEIAAKVQQDRKAYAVLKEETVNDFIDAILEMEAQT